VKNIERRRKMAHSFELDFYENKEQEMYSGPRASIFIKDRVSLRNNIAITLGEGASSIEDFYKEIKRLKKELDVIEKEARRKFEKAKQNCSGK
jgi:prefoldin subunit 5